MVIGFAIYGALDFFYYAPQQKQAQQAAAVKAAAAQLDFENQLKCADENPRLRAEFPNVVGVRYDSFLNTCMVKYFNNAAVVQEAPIGDLQSGNLPNNF